MKVYKVERQIPSSNYYQEVMLSPFKTTGEVEAYISKYRHYYPLGEQNYRITKDDGNTKIVKYFRGS
jgi:hypothetical protein